MSKKNYIGTFKIKRISVIILSVIILLMMYLFQNSSFTLRALTSIALIYCFYLIDHLFYIKFRMHHYLFVIIIVSTGLLLSPLYYIYPNYDKFQHFILPMLVYSIVFFMVKKQTIKLKWKLVFTFFIVVAILGLFEIGEYSLDYLFDLKTQGVYIRELGGLEKLNLIIDPLTDTMTDLIFGTLGSIFYSGITWVFYRKRIKEEKLPQSNKK